MSDFNNVELLDILLLEKGSKFHRNSRPRFHFLSVAAVPPRLNVYKRAMPTLVFAGTLRPAFLDRVTRKSVK